jgi:hypothetical protein
MKNCVCPPRITGNCALPVIRCHDLHDLMAWCGHSGSEMLGAADTGSGSGNGAGAGEFRVFQCMQLRPSASVGTALLERLHVSYAVEDTASADSCRITAAPTPIFRFLMPHTVYCCACATVATHPNVFRSRHIMDRD